MLVGITGGIGSGKSTVVEAFHKLGACLVYDADAVAKKLMTRSVVIREKLQQIFGNETYLGKELNRSFLANIVFSDPKKLAALNAVVHPVVAKDLQEFIKKHEHEVSYILYENAILFENQSAAICAVVITVTAPLETRIQRVIKRDQVSREAVLARIQNQWSSEKKEMQSHYCISNINAKETQLKVLEIHNKLTQKTL